MLQLQKMLMFICQEDSKLQQSLYALCQLPINFFKPKESLLGFTDSQADPWLFFSENVICLVYVDKLI